MIRSIGTGVGALALALLGGGTIADTGSGAADPDCWCRDPSGERRDLGAVECVTIGRSRYLVRCEMSTNTPYWRRLRDEAGCPLALAGR